MLGVFAGQVNLNSRFDVSARDGTNKCILKETRQREGTYRIAFCALQFRPCSPRPSHYSRYGRKPEDHLWNLEELLDAV